MVMVVCSGGDGVSEGVSDGVSNGSGGSGGSGGNGVGDFQVQLLKSQNILRLHLV